MRGEEQADPIGKAIRLGANPCHRLVERLPIAVVHLVVAGSDRAGLLLVDVDQGAQDFRDQLGGDAPDVASRSACFETLAA